MVGQLRVEYDWVLYHSRHAARKRTESGNDNRKLTTCANRKLTTLSGIYN